MRRIFLGLWLVFLIVLLTLAWRPRAFPVEADQPQSDLLPGDSNPPDLLYRRIDRIDFDHVPLERAIEQITGRFKVNHVVYWSEVYKRIGFPQDAIITLHLKNVTVGAALQAILDAASAGDIRVGVTDGILTIAGDGYFYRNDIEVYDIRDLLQDYVRYERNKGSKVPASQPSDPYRRALLAYVGMIKAQTGFAVEEGLDANSSRPVYSSAIDPLQPESGGSVWYDELAGRLIITAPRRMQVTIRELLDQFRRHPISAH